MSNSDYKQSRGAQFAPLSELFEPVSYLDRTLVLGRANFPRIDSLKIGMAALCDDEFMAITAIAPGRVSVKRGAADTVPAQHQKYALVWFMEIGTIGSDAKEHSAGETNAVKYSPSTIGGGSMDIADSDVDEVTYNWRQFRPYPPGQVRVRDDRWWIEHTLSADDPYLKVTWVHRDRTLQADQLVDHDEPGIGPEPGTTYTVRIYNESGVLRRTEAGIMTEAHDFYGQVIAPSWTYTWAQAIADLGVNEALEKGVIVAGRMTIFSTREGFDSWQGYEIPFKVNTQGVFLKVAQAAQQIGQVEDMDATGGPYPPNTGLYGAQIAHTVAQPLSDAENDAGGPTSGVYLASMHEGVGQQTSFYTTLNRNLFEAPYAHLRRRGDIASAAKLVTLVARPSDRLTDAHSIWTRYDFPRGRGDTLTFEQRVEPLFTPWITLGLALDYLDTHAVIAASSFYDGVSLENVRPGQVAMIDAEIVRIESRTETTVTIARGCYDTVPTKHNPGARMWFFEAMAGNDPTAYPLTPAIDGVLGAAVQVKMIPAVYGPPLDLAQVPTDRLDMQRRVERPYAPGEVLVNGVAWYRGAVIGSGQTTRITWNHRNRDTQADQVVDHHAPTRAPEPDQKYRLSIKLTLRDGLTSYTTTVRSEIVDGTEFVYTYAMASADGYRAGTLLKVCGRVTVGMVLETIRGDLVSWQNYVIPLALPSYSCPPGQPGGGGQLPPTTGGGNGDTGPNPDQPPGPGDNTGGGDPPAPGDDGDDGTGPPPPPDVPPDWPDPIDPVPEPDPDDPNPALAGHWDTNWDRHWDAYTKDNQGT